MKYIKKGDAAAKPLKSKFLKRRAMKKCSMCGPRPASMFYPRGGTGLLQSRCRDCTKLKAMESKKERSTRRESPFIRVLDV